MMMDSAKALSVAAKLTLRMDFPLCAPMSAATIAPPMGMASRSGSSSRSPGILSLFDLPAKPPYQGDDEHGDTEGHRQRIELGKAVLNRPERDTEQTRHLGQLIDDGLIQHVEI